jgi:NADPH:quinone reductase-like Zn-dependent oxidoreductase
MKAARIHHFGPPDAITIDEVPAPVPGHRDVLVRVAASGVGPWDALIREGKSKVSPRPPLTLGSDLSGVVEAVGPDVAAFAIGDELYGVTNPQFVGANAQFALAGVDMIAAKLPQLTHVEAASLPVVAVTAWQMLFEYANVVAGQKVLILGAAGSVGSYAVQMAVGAGLHVIAVASSRDTGYVRGLGAESCFDFRSTDGANEVPQVDAILDMVGGATLQKSLRYVTRGGIVVSVYSPESLPQSRDVRAVFFYVEVTTARLNAISELLRQGKLRVNVGTVLPLGRIREAHQMLAGAPHPRGKIVLTTGS